MRNSSLLFSILFFYASIVNLQAQLLDSKAPDFSRADSLRGSLSLDRSCYDVTYYDLKIALNIVDRSISGSNKIYFNPLRKVYRFQIDLFDHLVIDKIVFRNKEISYTREYNAVFVHLPDTLRSQQKEMIEVFYHGNVLVAKKAPWDGGFVFKKDAEGNDWIGVACEGMGASSWWPCKDYLGDEPDSMSVTCTYPKKLWFIGNGNMIRDEMQANDRTTQWKVSYPINTYNVTLNIANYKHFHDTYTSKRSGKTLDLDYYVLPYNYDKAVKQFAQVKPMLAVYEKYLGPYPFWNDGYALVETPYLGMEHQSAIAYGNDYKPGYAGSDFSYIGLNFDYIIIHESGHEWWGNSVSCKDIADLWIHEGFCTYSEALYVEGMYGKKKAQEYINAKQKTVGNTSPIQGIYGVNNEGDGDMYNKGMLFLNTVRTHINNDSLWFAAIYKLANEGMYHRTGDYNEIIRLLELYTKRTLRPLFEQYVTKSKLPTLVYKIEDKNKFMKTLYYKWITEVPNFQLRFHYTCNGKKKSLLGSNDWRSYDFKAKKIKKFNINQNNIYINVQQLN